MREPIRLTHSRDAIALTLIATPLWDEKISLALGVQFSEGVFPLSQGSVKYGLTGGTLKLHLQEADFTEFSQDITHYLPVTKFPHLDHPTWKFSLPAGLDILKTNAEAIPLGTIKPSSDNWSVEGKLTVGKSDILITEVEGLWRHDLRPNKQAVLHRKLALFLLDHYLASPLIWLSNHQSQQQETSPSELDTSALLTTLETIKTASSDEFLELCQMADLNPRLDFAGANLRGTTLRGLDVSEANWSRVNLRGADLTDIDVSEGNLQGAKLSGADLSGAYLSNANLKNADFHRASLALANLSGANLQGANLQEANLSQTNLNDCNLEGARFD